MDETHTQFFAVFQEDNTGLRAQITRGPRGYHVSIKDLDDGRYLPQVRIFKLTQLDDAIEYAKKVVD